MYVYVVEWRRKGEEKNCKVEWNVHQALGTLYTIVCNLSEECGVMCIGVGLDVNVIGSGKKMNEWIVVARSSHLVINVVFTFPDSFRKILIKNLIQDQSTCNGYLN